MKNVVLQASRCVGVVLIMLSQPNPAGADESALEPEAASGFVSADGMCLPPVGLASGGGLGAGGATSAGFAPAGGSGGAARGGVSQGGKAAALAGGGRGFGNRNEGRRGDVSKDGEQDPALELADNPAGGPVLAYQAGTIIGSKDKREKSAPAPESQDFKPDYLGLPLFGSGPSLSRVLREQILNGNSFFNSAASQNVQTLNPPLPVISGGNPPVPATSGGNEPSLDDELNALREDNFQGLVNDVTQSNSQNLEPEQISLLDDTPLLPPEAGVTASPVLSAVIDPAAVPEPAMLGLLGMGLLGLMGWRRRRA